VTVYIDSTHTIETVNRVSTSKPWYVRVAGAALRDRKGRTRFFKTERSARMAAYKRLGR